MNIIRFFDWTENGVQNIGASTINGNNEDADCYCFGNPNNWWSWDVDIVKQTRRLSDADARGLQVHLASLWGQMSNFSLESPYLFR